MMIVGKAQMGDTCREVPLQARHRRRVAILEPGDPVGARQRVDLSRAHMSVTVKSIPAPQPAQL